MLLTLLFMIIMLFSSSLTFVGGQFLHPMLIAALDKFLYICNIFFVSLEGELHLRAQVANLGRIRSSKVRMEWMTIPKISG